MKLFFHLPYRASPGETLCAALRLQTGSALLRRRVPLECLDGEHWKGATEISAPENTVLIYSYKIMRGEKQSAGNGAPLPARCLFVPNMKATVSMIFGGICRSSLGILLPLWHPNIPGSFWPNIRTA